MSLKDVHIIFIVAASVICAWFGVWSAGFYREHKAFLYLILSVLSFASVVALIVYLNMFIRKYRSKLS